MAKFHVGQRVRVVRKVPADAFYADLTGLEGTVEEIDEIKLHEWLPFWEERTIQVNYTVDGHYVHEEELEAVDAGAA